jgi:hypothetical protein
MQNFKSAVKSNGIFAFLIILLMTFSSYGQQLNGQYGIEFELCGATITFGAPAITQGQPYEYPLGTAVIGNVTQTWELVYEGAGSVSWALKGPTTQDGSGPRSIYYYITDTSSCSNIVYPSDDLTAGCWEEQIVCGGLTNITYLPSTGDPDADGDGYNASVDCDDTNAAINPGATEVAYDGIDNDCNPATLDDDIDQDGFVNANDCDDNDNTVNALTTYYVDTDGDNYGTTAVGFCSSTVPNGYAAVDGDCDDTDPAVNPGASEIPHNAIDDDCDPSTPDNDGSNVYVYCNEAETKVVVCHNGQDKCVSINAVDAHLDHGDTLGSCASAIANNQEETTDIEDITKGDPTTIDVAYWPNPSKDVFTIKMATPNFEDKIDLQVFDINGRLVHVNVIGANKNYQFGNNLSKGVYFVKLTQASTSKVLKVIKH